MEHDDLDFCESLSTQVIFTELGIVHELSFVYSFIHSFKHHLSVTSMPASPKSVTAAWFSATT